MESNDNKQGITLDQGSQIQLMVNSSSEEDELDLGQVVRNFKKRTPVFIWLVLLGLLLGMGGGLLKYQLDKKPTEVSSVVTLDYLAPVKEYDEEGNLIETENPEYEQVKDLTDPLGNELDLNQITSSYVLQNALNGMELSAPVTLSNLRANIRVERILTEESRQKQEMAARMMEQTSLGAAAYTQAMEVELVYDNRFIVTLVNGFGDEESRIKQYLKDNELAALLDRILESYNDYLVLTYADKKLPNDEIGVIDIENQDVMESLDLLRTATKNLITYCDEKPETVQNYRSWQTGYTLLNLENQLETVQDVEVDYLYSYVHANGIVRDVNTVLANLRYRLRNAKNQMDTLNAKIERNKKTLDEYKNDEIFVSMQESDSSKSTKTNTDYFNKLILEQAKYFEEAAELEITISDLENKIAILEAGTSQPDSSQAASELQGAIKAAYGVYEAIVNHMQEVFDSAFYTHYARASVAHGVKENFLTGSMKNMIIFGMVGAVLACGLWFLSAVAPEFMKKSKEEEEKKHGEK